MTKIMSRLIGRPGAAGLCLALAALGLGATAPASAATSGGGPGHLGHRSKCDPHVPYDVPRFNDRVHGIDRRWADSHTGMPRADARELLKVVWKRLYKQCHHRKLTRHQLRFRVDGNLRQIADDSGFIPAARSPTGQHAKGLLQMIDTVFHHWYLPGYKHVYHPLDDILAAVNIQLEAGRVISVADGYHYPQNVLDGHHHGWGFHGGDNPYRPFR